MSRGDLSGGGPDCVATNANTKMFDGAIRHAWQEHALMTVHLQDGRWPQFIRDWLRERFEKKFGRRG